MAVTAAVAVFYVVGASADNLSGSTFDTSNGSLTPSSASLHDWNPKNKPDSTTNPLGPLESISCPSSPGAGTNCGLDWVGSSSDNSFTQGTKEDSTAVVVSTGSIPPNKDDLSRFYVNTENNSNGIFLDLAWERSNLLGSAHMDFEFNQAGQPTLVCPTGVSSCSKTLNRTANDILLDFDFGGSGPVTLTEHKWLVGDSNPSVDCEAVSSGTNVNCWSKGVDLTAAGDANASVNAASVSDYNPPVPAAGFNTLAGSTKTQGGTTTVSSTFGEATINLTLAGVFTPGQCTNFGDAWLKSRSSGSSFTSDMKDFIAPIPISVSNCGTVIIHKQTDPRGVNTDFTFSTNVVDNVPTGSTDTTCQEATSGTTSYTLNDTGNSGTGNSAGNTDSCSFVPAGDYTVSEGSEPAGFSFEGLTCTTSGIGATVDDGGGPQTSLTNSSSTSVGIHVAPDTTTTCTFTNQQHQGAILVTKQGKDHNCTSGSTSITEGTCVSAALADLSGAKFQVWKETNGCTGLQTAVSTCNGGASTAADTQVGSEKTTGAAGTACFDGLSWSGAGTSYYVIESGAPTGFANDNAAGVTRVVTQNAKCSDSNIASEAATWTATDQPLTNLTVTVSSALAHATNSSISCVVHGTANNIGNSPVPSSGLGDPETMNANSGNSKQLEPGTYDCQIVIDP
jgi:hypothetical protein